MAQHAYASRSSPCLKISPHMPCCRCPTALVPASQLMQHLTSFLNSLHGNAQGVLAPIGGKRLVAFIDDFNMPQKTTFGFIPALELLKHWVHYGFW